MTRERTGGFIVAFGLLLCLAHHVFLGVIVAVVGGLVATSKAAGIVVKTVVHVHSSDKPQK